MSRNFVCLSLAVAVALVGAPALSQTLAYNFDDGTDDGWAPLPGLAGNSLYYLGATTYDENGTPAQSGAYMINSICAEDSGTIDDYAGPTATLASPAFTLNGSGPLTFYLLGGSCNYASQVTNTSQILANRSDDSWNSRAGGFMGALLIQVATGNVVLDSAIFCAGDTGGYAGYLGWDGENGESATWQETTWSTAQLAPYVNDGNQYELALINSKFGNWGWIALDTVSIPGAVPGTGNPGDVNGDGRVDINDLTIVLSNFGQTGCVWSQGSMDGDPTGTVDVNDLTLVLANFGTTYGASSGIKAVPEPSTIALGLAGAVCLVAFALRRRA